MSQTFHIKSVQVILYLCWTSRIVFSQELNTYRNSESNEGGLGSSYFYYQRPDYPKDCTEVENQCSTNNLSGVYLIKPDGYPEPFEVYCDTVNSGGWTVIYRLRDGSILFNRNWTDFKTGFGFLSQEFWLGNDKLSFLTNQNTYELRIELTSDDGLSFYVTYSRFRISDEYSEYKLTSVGDYNGTEDEINRFMCPTSSEGVVYILPNCSQRCSCTGGQFACDDDYQCSPNAVCKETINGSQCYCNLGFAGDGVNCAIYILPCDCQDVFNRGSTESGVYQIKPATWPGEPFDVYCNMSDGGGWTVFQRRVNGAQNFYLYWSDYKDGFGTPEHELWLGNDKLNNLTTQKSYELRIDFVNSLGNPYYAKYSSFRINDEHDKYRLSLGGYSEGNAGDQMDYNNDRPFTTRDRDNDDWGGNCASDFRQRNCDSRCHWNAGWWYGLCSHTHLNSPYGTGCFHWTNLPGSQCNIRYTEMKVRPS